MDEVLKLALEQREATGREGSADLVVPAPGMVTH
jgi:hypothetical protein